MRSVKFDKKNHSKDFVTDLRKKWMIILEITIFLDTVI